MKKSVLPCAFSEIGNKDNQEDYLYPLPENVQPGQKYFILCDGMGGHDCGEVASETVSTALGRFFDQHPVERVDGDYFNEALAYAYTCLDAKDTGSDKKMGTTMTCLYFNPDSFLAAHIGDSRIYQFRDGKVLFQTQDHSLVNDLLKAGEITEEEAKNYPRKNVITRAMQPNARRSRADIFVSDDILPGDYFFMCCDGVLERADTDFLCRVFADKTSSPSAKLNAIKAECDKGTKDNYTCWLIPVTSQFAEPSKIGKTQQTEGLIPAPKHSHNRPSWWLLLALTILGVVVGLLLGRKIYKEPANVEDPAPEQVAVQTSVSPEEVGEGHLPFSDEYNIIQYERDSLKQVVDSLSRVLERMKEL